MKKKTKKQYMNYGILGIMIIALLSGTGNAVAVCENETYIKYIDNFTINGDVYGIETVPTQCNQLCIQNLNGIGAICENEVTVSYTLLTIWVFAWIFLIWFERWYKKTWRAFGTYKLVPYFAFFVNAWLGLIITTSLIMVLPIFLTFFMFAWTAKTELIDASRNSQNQN